MAQGIVFHSSNTDLSLDADSDHLRVYERQHGLYMDRFPGTRNQDMSVTGRRVRPTFSSPPKIYMWSPDESIKLPTNNAFAYRLSLQRSLTEIKLLGQRSYPAEKRGSVSSEGVACREIVGKYLRDIGRNNPSASVHNSDISPIVRETTPRQPPPTREVSNLSHSPLLKHVSKSQQEQSQKAPPSDIYLNLKRTEGSENKCPREMFSARTTKPEGSGNWRVDHNGTVRRVKTVLDLKTREETTLNNRERMVEREKPDMKLAKSKLERTYDKIPSMSKVNQTGNDVVVRPRHGGKQYGKSEFALSMQASISKKMLNKQALPVAFRKNHSTYLKFYGTPMLEENCTRIFNTPASVSSPFNIG